MVTWYEEGLKFKCTGCGKCCTGAPGGVFVSLEEIDAMAKFLGCTKEVFLASFVKKEKNRFVLRDQSKEHDCIFLQNQRCQVYQARPKQCRTYPWWKENLSSARSWIDEMKRCEGIEHSDGKHFSKEEIDATLES